MERVTVDLASRSYDIVIGSGLLDRASTYESLPRAGRAAIVTNDTVGPLYADRLESELRGRYDGVVRIVLPDGEGHKDWHAVETVIDALLDAGCGRQTMLFALGGGVVGDVAGFAAASYMRGIPFVQVPTTLLAQVDSSVGGKTGINHARGKNLIGAFHQPRLVVADLDTLDTLPARELAAGLAEVIKYGPIADARFFDWIEANIGALAARDKPALLQAVKKSCELKASVVRDDEREAGSRAVLNFGHTFGHAIEVGTGFGTWLHGEAVAVGMVMAAELSVRLGLLPASQAARLGAVLRAAGLPTVGPKLDPDRYRELMAHDKKADDSGVRYVLLDRMGHALLRAAPDAMVQQVIMDLSA
jgi:3-dehydroquinate synthase